MRNLVLASCLALVPSVRSSQVITGSVFGAVLDDSGGVLPGATVTISSPALPSGPATVVTNAKGQYRFPKLSPGTYILEITLSGFAAYREEGLRVEVGGSVERRVVLTVAGITENVTVTGESPLVDTRKSGLSTNYGKEYVGNTPLQRFSMFDLLVSAPGMSPSSGLTPAISAFGPNTDENTFLLDGTDFTAPVSGSAWPWPDPDVIEEVEIISLGASAEYGNVTGAVFNVVTRQGTNELRLDAS